MESAAATGGGGRREHAARERLLVPVRFALLRLRRQAPRTLIVALGIAVGAAVLAMTAVGSASVQDRAVQRALAQLPPSDRAIQAVWSGVPAQSNLSYPQLDRIARRVTTPILGQPPFAVAVFRQATWGGAFVNLGAVDKLARWLALRSGRLPKRCVPDDCELIQIGGAPAAPKLPFLHVVGRATFRPGAPLQSYFGGGGEKRPPILLARRRAAVRARTASRRAPHRAHVRLDRPCCAALDPRLAARRPRRAPRPRAGDARAALRHLHDRGADGHDSGDPRDEPRRGASGCSSSAATRRCCCSASRCSRRRDCAATTATCDSD